MVIMLDARPLRGHGTALPEMRDGVSAKFLFLPDGEDPDTMVRKLGKEAFLQQVDSALPPSEFLEQLSEGIDDSTADGKARPVRSAHRRLTVYHRVYSATDVGRASPSHRNLGRQPRDYVAHKPPSNTTPNPLLPKTSNPWRNSPKCR